MGKKDKVNDQPSLNQFFQSTSTPAKRNLEEIIILSSDDDDDDDLAGPSTSTTIPIKRLKVEESSTTSSLSSARPPVAKTITKSFSKVAKFKYDPQASTSSTSSIPRVLTEEERNRKAAFAKRLSTANWKSAYLEPDHYLGNRENGGGEGVTRQNSEEDGGEEENDEEEVEEGEVTGKGKKKASAKKGKGREKEAEEVVESRFSRFAAEGSTTSSSPNSTSTSTPSSSKGKGKEVAVKFTPLELQVLELKRANPGVLLMVEVGYKMRFFGEDAITASRVLNIAQFPSKHMMSASIPVHRLPVHLKRLISAGHKVGVVRQLETAALKKISDNKTAPFTRALTSLTTSATFIDELHPDTLNIGSGTATLLCLVEAPKGKKKPGEVEGEEGGKVVKIGLIAVMPSTGEVVYDEFEDGFTRSELETRLLHLQPNELLLPQDLSKPTESLVTYHTGQVAGLAGMTCRTEVIKKKLSNEAAHTFVANFYAKAKQTRAACNSKKQSDTIVIDDIDDEEKEEAVDPELNKVLSLGPRVLVALASLITYLKSFQLDTIFLHTLSFRHFSSRSTMTLNANSIANLEILRNNTDFKEGRGSLLSVIDRCKTGMGRRLLRRWVAKPLVSVCEVNERLDAITEINASSGLLPIVSLRKLFSGLPDLERGLARIYFGKATTSQEVLKILQSFKRVGECFGVTLAGSEGEEADDRMEGCVTSILLKKIVRALPRIRVKVTEFLDELNIDKAREGLMDEMFKPSDKLESLQDAKECLSAVEYEMNEELNLARKFLKKPKLEFIKVAQEEFLLNLTITDSKKLGVPNDWLKVNSTGSNYRWRSPGIQKKKQEIEQAREHLANEAKLAFKNYLAFISESYEDLRAAINFVATADCLYSLASVAQAPGYCRPEIVSEAGRLDIIEGRSPIVEVILTAPFVPNSIKMGGESTRQMLLTGLNLGGKSTFAKSVALIALLAQIGSYCPAESVTTSLFDGIYTRMGASDDIARGRSTFMVEMSETAEILKLATPRSLIILDELGRGTSTHDGLAIAGAVLEHIVTVKKSLCIFVTHYPSLSELANRYPDSISVNHMSCLEQDNERGFADVVFLYKLVEGLASRSHGLNVARLSKLPDSVLAKAVEKSREMEDRIKLRTLQQRAVRVASLLKSLSQDNVQAEAGIGLAYSILYQAE